MKIREDAEDLNHILSQIELIDICRTFYPQTAEYTLSANSTKLDHVLIQKQVWINLKGFRSYKVWSPITMELN